MNFKIVAWKATETKETSTTCGVKRKKREKQHDHAPNQVNFGYSFDGCIFKSARFANLNNRN